MKHDHKAIDAGIKIGFWPADRVTWPADPAWTGAERDIVVAHLLAPKFYVRYRGISRCRVCGCANGSDDYGDGTYTWPSGLAHYLIEHHLRPPDEFIRHILAEVDVMDDAMSRCADEAAYVDHIEGQRWEAMVLSESMQGVDMRDLEAMEGPMSADSRENDDSALVYAALHGYANWIETGDFTVGARDATAQQLRRFNSLHNAQIDRVVRLRRLASVFLRDAGTGKKVGAKDT
jgi:hypothetical protein